MKRLQVIFLIVLILAISAGAGFSSGENVHITYGGRVDYGNHPGYLYFRFAPEPYPPAVSRQAHIYHYKDTLSGESGFCLHPNRLSAQGDMVQNPFYAFLPKDDLYKLELAVEIGFREGIEGFEDENLRYMFAQRYIWETVPVRYYGSNPDFTDTMGTAIVTWRYLDGGTNRTLNQIYEEWKEELEERIEESLITPSFSDLTVTLKKGESTVLADSHDRLKDYMVESAPEGVEVSISDNLLTIEASQYAQCGTVALRHRSFERGVSFVYTHEDPRIQDLGIFRVSAPLEVMLEVEIEEEPLLSQIQVVKIDAVTKEVIAQPGIRFSLFREESGGEPIGMKMLHPGEQILTEFVTDENGILTFPEKLPFETYWLEEREGAYGYYLDPQQERIKVEVDNEQTVIYVENVPQTGVLELEKRGEQFVRWQEEEQYGYTVTVPVFEEAYLEGAKYILEKEGECICEIVTGSEPGRMEGLELGSYILRETESPHGYLKDDEIYEIEFTPQESGKKIHLLKKSLINARQSARLVFEKETESSIFIGDRAFEDVLFGLYNKEEMMGIPAGTLMGVSGISERGEGYFDLFIEGEYILKELATHDALCLGEEEFLVEYVYSEDEGEGQIFFVDVGKNILKRSTFKIIKIEKGKGTPLSGACLIVESEVDGERISFGEMVTDDKGECRWELVHGKYIIREKEAPSGYRKSILEKEIYVNGDKELRMKWENEPNMLIIKKTDKATRKPLQAGFHLFNNDGILKFRFSDGVYRPDPSGEALLMGDEEGEVVILALPSGRYSLEEIDVPPGYEKADKVEFSFFDTLEVIVENKAMPKLPDTGDRTEYALRGASTLILIGVLIFLYKSRSAL